MCGGGAAPTPHQYRCWRPPAPPAAAVAPAQRRHQPVVPSAVADGYHVAGLEKALQDIRVPRGQLTQLEDGVGRVAPENAAVRIDQVDGRFIAGEVGLVKAPFRAVGDEVEQVDQLEAVMQRSVEVGGEDGPAERTGMPAVPALLGLQQGGQVDRGLVQVTATGGAVAVFRARVDDALQKLPGEDLAVTARGPLPSPGTRYGVPFSLQVRQVALLFRLFHREQRVDA